MTGCGALAGTDAQSERPYRGLLVRCDVGTNWRYRVQVGGDVGTIVPFGVRIRRSAVRLRWL